jgi:hypothetical protein
MNRSLELSPANLTRSAKESAFIFWMTGFWELRILFLLKSTR